MITMPTDPRFENLIDRVFGRLTVQSYAGHKHGGHRWNCRCECGASPVVGGRHMKSGKQVSCGCHAQERRIKHGLYQSEEYVVWEGMNQRCNNRNMISYRHYGGRGITICERWRDFGNFYADMGPRPSKRHSIDRIDNDGNYEPGNCCWATRKQQSNNTRGVHKLTHQGKTQSIAAWAEQLGLCGETIHKRLRLGWSVDRTLSTPVAIKPQSAK